MEGGEGGREGGERGREEGMVSEGGIINTRGRPH